jgi:hypothetical protein
MKKIRLDLDALAVDSFDANPDVPGYGTVGANASIETDTCIGPSCRRCPTDTGSFCSTCGGNTCASCDPSCVNTCGTCQGMNTCDASCPDTCYDSCNGTCGEATCGGGYTCYDSCTCPI